MQNVMSTVKKIIEKHGNGSFTAGLENLKNAMTGEGEGETIHINHGGYMPLNIQWAGEFGGCDTIAVSHTYTQNGDVMFDPEMVFQVDEEGYFYPISYRQDNAGMYQEAKFKNEEGKMMVNLVVQKELRTFSRMWNKNLREQGFIKAYSQN